MDTLYVNTDIFLVVKYVLLSKKKKKKEDFTSHYNPL